MPRRFAGLVVASDVPLGDLPSASGPADITISRASIDPAAGERVQTWTDDTGDWLTIDRAPDGYRLIFPELQCAVSSDGSRIGYDAPDLPDAELAHLLLHQVLPLAVSRRGSLVLHACAVATPRGAIGLIGQSGAGKSTLAATFCRHGCELVADDALVIDITEDGVRVAPTAEGLRLWEDMAVALQSPGAAAAGSRRKRRVPAPLAAGAVPLVRLFLIGEGMPGPVRTIAVPPAEARIELLSHLFRLDVSDADESRRLFHLAHRLAAQVPLQRLEFPDGVEFLDPAVHAVLRGLETP